MKILLLTSSTGGGHDMRALSFEQWAKHPDCANLNITTERLQVLELTHPTYNFGVTLYNWIQRHAPWLHHIYFSFLELADLHVHASEIMGQDVFKDKIKSIKPDVIISTHAHLNHGFFSIAREALGRNNVRCITYCGELFGNYGFSKHWVNPQADMFIGADEETCREAARHGMPLEKNWLGGYMLNPKFYEKHMSDDERRKYISSELNLDPDRFILLLATGANGANNHMSLIKAIAKSGMQLQVVALCGKDEDAKKEIESWASSQTDIKIKALPYYTKMNVLMQAVSAIVARPGTGTTSEAILSGCPIIFNGIGGVMPQEYITLKFARKHGIGKLIMSPRSLPSCIADWLSGNALEIQKKRMAHARPKRTPLDILKNIVT